MQYEYELIPHDYGEYHLFLVELLYRTPHMHRDFELSWILDGETEVSFGPEKLILKKLKMMNLLVVMLRLFYIVVVLQVLLKVLNLLI